MVAGGTAGAETHMHKEPKKAADGGRAERERAARTERDNAKAEAERAEKSKVEREKAARAKAEAERAVKSKAEREKAARAKAEAERAEKSKAEREKAARAKAERERLEKASKASREQAARDKEEAARKAKAADKAERHKVSAPATTTSVVGGAFMLPPCMEFMMTPEVTDLVIGTLIMVAAIAIFAFVKHYPERRRRKRAMNRSLSCPALVELKSKRALDAAAHMMAAFDERGGSRRTQYASKGPAMPRVVEGTGETSNSWTPRSTPRQSPRSTPRQSPHDSPRTSPRHSPRQSATSSPRSSPTPPADALTRDEEEETWAHSRCSSIHSDLSEISDEWDLSAPSRLRRLSAADEWTAGASPQPSRHNFRALPASREALPAIAAVETAPLMAPAATMAAPSLASAADLAVRGEPRDSPPAGRELSPPRPGRPTAPSWPSPISRPCSSLSAASEALGTPPSNGSGVIVLGVAAGGWQSRHQLSGSPLRSVARRAHSERQELGSFRLEGSVSPVGCCGVSPKVGRRTSPAALTRADVALQPLPHVIVLGDAGVGKSAVMSVLESFAASNDVELQVWEGRPEQRDALACAVPLVVWDAIDGKRGPLRDYVCRHLHELTQALAAVGGSAREREALVSRVLVLCNKSDVQPCPLPEFSSLEPGVKFLAGSATRGTNMRELWRLVETCAAPRPKGHTPHDTSPIVPSVGGAGGLAASRGGGGGLAVGSQSMDAINAFEFGIAQGDDNEEGGSAVAALPPCGTHLQSPPPPDPRSSHSPKAVQQLSF